MSDEEKKKGFKSFFKRKSADKVDQQDISINIPADNKSNTEESIDKSNKDLLSGNNNDRSYLNNPIPDSSEKDDPAKSRFDPYELLNNNSSGDSPEEKPDSYKAGKSLEEILKKIRTAEGKKESSDNSDNLIDFQTAGNEELQITNKVPSGNTGKKEGTYNEGPGDGPGATGVYEESEEYSGSSDKENYESFPGESAELLPDLTKKEDNSGSKPSEATFGISPDELRVPAGSPDESEETAGRYGLRQENKSAINAADTTADGPAGPQIAAAAKKIFIDDDSDGQSEYPEEYERLTESEEGNEKKTEIEVNEKSESGNMGYSGVKSETERGTGKESETDDSEQKEESGAEEDIITKDFRKGKKPEDKITDYAAEIAKEYKLQDFEDKIKAVDTEIKIYPAAKKTRWSDEGGYGDREISYSSNEEFSDLILPKGATIELEDFKLKSKDKAFLPEEKDEILSRIDSIFSKNFPDEKTVISGRLTDFKRKKKGKIFGETKPAKKFFSGFKKPEKVYQAEYNPSVHGSIVDLTFNPENVEGLEEVELYPVNEPYAYVRIIYDKNTNEHIYNVIEPSLNKAEEELLQEIKQRLFETLDVNTKDVTKEESYDILKISVSEIIQDYGIKIDPPSKAKILYMIYKEFLGDGLIDPIMHDKFIEDISCDGLNVPIFVYHSNYESMQTTLSYEKSTNLDSFVTRLAQRAGKYISIAEPMLDATMSDGSRIQMTLGTEVTAHGSTFTIRKFKEEPITPTDLIEWGTFTPLSIAYIWLAVESGKSCIFAGGTASGKTTSLNAISLFIPPLAKIVTLEDTRELKLPHKNWIPSITRESFDSDGKGSIDMYELLRAALRQRPEYIIVGEVRGNEALTLFQAMSTGHITYATMHADSVASVVHRLENPPLNVPRNMLNALHLVSVQVQSRVGGQRIRRNKQLIEILDIDPRTRELITNDVFKWYAATDEIRYSGKSYILEEIMEERGWNEERIREELKRRQEILEWMRIKKLRNYKDVGKVLMSYYRDPDAIMNLVRADLYE
ncbi:ATPase, T2SS/T4P/T4SS family [Methanoplanus limicola]|uniref:Type II secretion system protein E n=1 Tax=Methanoplanus limicola DSM 2279 TaxID=937775 RepID=H1YWJ5_9EURY|nr:type II secretion system protein E [Methanoplanus limicola DSM 2279]